MADFTANFTLSETEAIDATFIIRPAPSKLSELENDADYVQDADYVHTDNNFTDTLLSNLNNQSGINTGDQIIPTATSDLNNDSGFITSASVPTTLSELTDDSTHRLVTDTEKSTWNAKQNALGYTPENVANKNANNGYCGLDSGGKVPSGNLPSTLLKYIGNWNASTNTPTLTTPDLTKVGYVYNVSVAGTQFGISFSLGDWLIYNSSGVPEKSDNSDDVVSVNGRTGIVTGLANLAGGNTFTGDQTFDTNTLFIDSVNDKVGIGTSTPTSAKLQIEAGNGVVGQFINGGTDAEIDLLKLKANGATQRLILEGAGTTPVQTFLEAGGSIGLFGTITNSDFRIRTNYADRVSITASGNVGIGTTSPASKLQVVGLKEYADNAAAIAAGLTAGAFYRTGDLLKVVH